uniref:Small ribosomal subunit protein mS31 n=1 Tax=Branchiostoma floridae TaxID=7739 RepID=C3XUQ7_BRAFL|eukprot:XP_002612247.1 hypothetical protein BRAFLDRAFT_129249 [Branchiostoma floridae]
MPCAKCLSLRSNTFPRAATKRRLQTWPPVWGRGEGRVCTAAANIGNICVDVCSSDGEVDPRLVAAAKDVASSLGGGERVESALLQQLRRHEETTFAAKSAATPAETSADNSSLGDLISGLRVVQGQRTNRNATRGNRFERKVKRRSGKVKQNLLRCFTRDSNLKTRKIAWPEQPRSVKTTQNNEDAVSVKTAQSNEDAVSVKTTQSEEDALSVKCTLNEDAVSVKTTQSKEDALSVKCTLSNEDEVSVKTTQSNEDALSGDSSFSDDVSDVSTLTTESESSSFSDNVSDVSTLATESESSSFSDNVSDVSTLTTESESSRCSDDVSDVSTLTTESESSSFSDDVSDVSTLATESESSSFSDDVSDVSTLTTESDTESSTSRGSFESVIDLPVSPPKPSRGQTTPVSKTREEILLKNIARAGFQIDPVPRNGDCFFGAAARQLGRGDPRIDTTALQLRKDLVHHIRAHSEKFCVAVPGGFWAFQQELDRLARRGHWCSDVADVLPIALADFTSREVVLITSTDMQIMVLPPEGEESGTPLVLAYLTTPGGEHYDAVSTIKSPAATQVQTKFRVKLMFFQSHFLRYQDLSAPRPEVRVRRNSAGYTTGQSSKTPRWLPGTRFFSSVRLHSGFLALERAPTLWDEEQKAELEAQVDRPPRNGFEEMIQWTKEGKMWTFPIQNDQDHEAL